MMKLIKPQFIPPLDNEFQPAVLANNAFRNTVIESNQVQPFVLGLERSDGSLSRYETFVYPDDHPNSVENLMYIERLVKFLLWQRGGWRIYAGGSPVIGKYLQNIYSPSGARAFDYHFMGEKVYQRTFTIMPCTISDVPQNSEHETSLGRHLDGYRIGFDLGASDIKVSAVVNGEAIFSTEIVWEPGKQTNPAYHYEKIKIALDLAASKMPKVDAIGGSSAGIYINNCPMVATLFRGIPDERFDEIRNLFRRISDEYGVPLEIANDGEITALAGSMSLNDNCVLGIALGSSEAGGFVTRGGKITNWLNELAFCPVDYNPKAPTDEWSTDRGCGGSYFSQQCVFRLAPKAGINLPQDMPATEKLKLVQEKLESGHAGAEKIWQSIGIYMGYAIAHYADFYDLRHILILGRCTSGSGGAIILNKADQVLQAEFPDLAKQIEIHLPDEKIRRVGQSIAAASLPNLMKW
jgi:predicted NBD/HSP70 family sugar kinase